MILKPANYFMNGDMRISQRATSFAAIADSTYSLDRIRYFKSGAMVHTVTQDTDVPTLAQAGYLFQNSIRFNLTTPDTSIAATDRCEFNQAIEGFNFANIAQKVFTLSFWVKATLAGTYCAAFANSGTDRSYVAEYVINSANTWEHKQITVSASPSAGTWNYSNGLGLYVRFVLAAGSNFNTTAGAWQTGNFISTSNQVNGVNTGATDFRITGVMVNEGAVAHPFRLHGGDYGEELMACLRYCQPLGLGMIGRWANANGWDYTHVFPVKMRTGPSILQMNTSISLNQIGINNQNLTSATVSLAQGSTYGAIGSINGSGGTATAGNVGALLTDGAAFFTAEL